MSTALPILPILQMAAATLFVGLFLVWRKVSIRRQDQHYASFRAGELASRLKLDLVEGDPAFNLFVTQANTDVARGPRDGRPVRVGVHLRGVREGLVVELIYDFRWERETGIARVTWRRWFDSRLVVTPRNPFPAFEVASRRAQPGPVVATTAIAPIPTGHALVDQAYAVATREPALARLLGERLGGFAFLGEVGVHLVGDGRSIAFVLRQNQAPLVPSVLFHAERVVDELVKLAQAIGG